MSTKKAPPKASPLHFDIEKYLNKDLLKDNLVLTRKIEALNKELAKVKEALDQERNTKTNQSSKELRKIHKKVRHIHSLYGSTDLQLFVDGLAKLRKTPQNKIKHVDLIDAIYGIVDPDDDWNILPLMKAIIDLSCDIDNYIGDNDEDE